MKICLSAQMIPRLLMITTFALLIFHPLMEKASALELTQGNLITLSFNSKTSLPIRANPPGGFFTGKGEEIGKTNHKEEFVLLNHREVFTITGYETWVLVAPMSPDGPDLSRAGWVFAGKGDKMNFIDTPGKNHRIELMETVDASLAQCKEITQAECDGSVSAGVLLLCLYNRKNDVRLSNKCKAGLGLWRQEDSKTLTTGKKTRDSGTMR